MRFKYLAAFLIIASLLSYSCTPLTKARGSRDHQISKKELTADIDYLYENLSAMHPRLDEYIPKEELKYKFDSLKNSLPGSMSRNDFYFSVFPLITSIKQGHTRLLLPNIDAGVADSFSKTSGRSSLLDGFKFEILNDKVYIVKSGQKAAFIEPYTELLSVNGKKLPDLLIKYRSSISTDGYNTSYTDHFLNTQIAEIIDFESEGSKQYRVQLKYNDQITNISIPDRQKRNHIKKNERKKREILGYNEQHQCYSKELTFLDKDSLTAILKITDFFGGEYHEMYKKSFNLLDSLNTQNLILDLRDNLGGSVSDAMGLFANLTDTSFRFIDRSEVSSKHSFKEASYFRGFSLSFKALLLINYPFKMLGRRILAYGVQEDANGMQFIELKESFSYEPRPKHFKGQLYVLINGGSYSAASTMAANIKETGKAIFVGEETGGASNGMVAGRMSLLILPNSKLNLIFGLMHIKPAFESESFGHGVFPDIEISPTLQDRINGVDPELEWILNYIKEKQGK